MKSALPRRRVVAGAAAIATGLTVLIAGPGAGSSLAAPLNRTTTPIKHVVVIFQENVSFDHYFGTYPNATNTSGQPFTAAPGTPAVNGLSAALLTANPNGVNPRRYDPTNINDVLTCDQDHNYTDEQKAFDGGAMDKFVSTVGNGKGTSPTGKPCVAGDVMNYYDGNTVTGLWNYAQHYAMSDNSFGTTFGPSSPGAINLVSGDTGGVDMTHIANNPSIATAAKPNADLVPDGKGGYSLISDAQPYWDDCSTRDAVAMSGQNIGDKLNAAGLSWGFFQGGYRPTTSYSDALATTGNSGQSTAQFIPDQFSNKFQSSVPNSTNQGICNAVHPVGAGLTSPLTPGTGQYGYKDDYIPHHQPFNYYASTANPHHLTLPTDANGNVSRQALATIGTDTQHYANGAPQFDTPNHQYDTSDFDQLVAGIGEGNLPPSALPAVSFLKAPGYQDGHAAYSDPLDEQQFIAREINGLMKTPDWSSTAVVINYDDSDGWYDHAYSGVTNPSQTVADALTGPGQCGTTGTPLDGQQGRCGYGPRQPMLVISPWAKANNVDHTLTDQSSVIRFVEDNWGLGHINGSFDNIAGSFNGLFDFTKLPNVRPLLLDPTTGQVQATPTNISLHVAPNPGFLGIPEILIANVSPFNAAGTVQFKDGTQNLGGPVPVTGGIAISTTTALGTGTHPLTAVFTPTDPAAFGPSTSPPATVTVSKFF
jgi:phospholipase C